MDGISYHHQIESCNQAKNGMITTNNNYYQWIDERKHIMETLVFARNVVSGSFHSSFESGSSVNEKRKINQEISLLHGTQLILFQAFHWFPKSLTSLTIKTRSAWPSLLLP